LVILGYVLGLNYGPNGVAAGFSITTTLLVVPVILWATHGTSITPVDTLTVIMRPFLSVLVGAGATLAAWGIIHQLTAPLLRLIAANSVLFGVYILVLWFGMGQKEVFLRLFADIGVWPFGKRGRDESLETAET